MAKNGKGEIFALSICIQYNNAIFKTGVAESATHQKNPANCSWEAITFLHCIKLQYKTEQAINTPFMEPGRT